LGSTGTEPTPPEKGTGRALNKKKEKEGRFPSRVFKGGGWGEDIATGEKQREEASRRKGQAVGGLTERLKGLRV